MKKTCTISNGASLSSAIDMGPNCRIRAILMPGAWTAADISFQVSDDGVTFSDVVDDANNAVKCTSPAATKMVGLRLDIRSALGRFQFIKLQSGTPGALTTQGADRVLTVFAEDPIKL